MGVEFGKSLSYVYITEDGLNGLEREGLEQARDMVRDSVPESEFMIEALDRVLSSNSSAVVDDMHSEGNYLMASLTPYNETRFPEGLIQLRGLDIENKEYMIVKMGLWTPPIGFDLLGRNIPWREEENSTTIDSMIDMGLETGERNDAELSRWGIPVNRLTKVVPVHPQYSHYHDGEFIYGHRSDLLEIERMRISDDMKAALIVAAEAKHQVELS